MANNLLHGEQPVLHQLQFRGVARQRGAGLGGIFKFLTEKAYPFFQNFIKPHAGSAIKSILEESKAGNVPVKESIKRHSKSALKGMVRQYVNQSGAGYKRRKKKKIKSKKPKLIKKCKKKCKNKFRFLNTKKSFFD